MKRRILSLLLTMCVCIACLPISVSAATPEWSTAYRDFLLSGRYVDAFDYECLDRDCWGTDEKYVTLHDMDGDSIPELFISNGNSSHLGRASYIFTYYNGQIVYIGNGTDWPIYYPGTAIKGIAGEYTPEGNAGTHTISYRWKDGNTLRRELVYSCDMYGNNVERLTDNDELFRVCRAGGKSLYENRMTVAKLKNEDWETFVRSVVPGYNAGIGFIDVAADAYYSKAVAWAVENSITSGTTPTTFSPNQNCTRAQAVTFLWNAAGKPDPQSSYSPFTDVAPADWYYKAVLWAVENDITSGIGNGKFNPSGICSRGQIATFLWRTENKPSSSLTYSPFRDISVGDYYYEAILWAAENGIAAGSSSHQFDPNGNCTRAQIVTFLYRHMVEPIDVDLTPPDESMYESILASMPGAVSAQYDIDGDGIRELLVCREAGSGFVRSIAGSVYTIRDGQIVELMRDKEIMTIASVPDGGLGVVKKDGRLYICLRGTNSGFTPPHGNTPSYTAYSGTYKLYALSGGSLVLSEECDYVIRARSNAAPFQTEISVKRSGTTSEIDYASYQQWCNSLSWLAKAGNVSGKINAYY